MADTWIKLAIYTLCLIASTVALSGIDFSKIMLRGKQEHMKFLYILLSMGLAWICGNFLYEILYFYR